METLKFTLSRHWYDMIESGEDYNGEDVFILQLGDKLWATPRV